MSIRYKCVECDAPMKIKDELAGTKGHCPKCKAEFTVPELQAAVPAEAKASAHELQEAKVEESAEDMYQRILMGDSDDDTGKRRRPADSDHYLSVDPSDDAPATPEQETHVDFARKTDAPTTKSPPRTTAEISAALMKNTAEPTLKKTGKAFGEVSNDRVGARAKASAEARNYYTKQISLIVVGAFVVAGGLYWLMNSMLTSTEYPPLGRVYGKVTLDGKPLGGAMVTFQPITEGPKANTKIGGSAGVTDDKGQYTIYYVVGVPGAVIGKHLVQVRAQSDVGLELVPERFNQNTQLTTEVKSGSNPFDIPIVTK